MKRRCFDLQCREKTKQNLSLNMEQNYLERIAELFSFLDSNSINKELKIKEGLLLRPKIVT